MAQRCKHVTAGRGLFQSSLPGALGPFQLLSGVIRPEKLGLDPTFQVIALYLHPVPLALGNFEAFAFGDYPKNIIGEALGGLGKLLGAADLVVADTTRGV